MRYWNGHHLWQQISSLIEQEFFAYIPPINLRYFTQTLIFRELISTYMILLFMLIYIKVVFLVYLLKPDDANPYECTFYKK